MPKPIDGILNHQLTWARKRDLALMDDPRYRYYLAKLEDNLYGGGMSMDTHAAYAKGKGSELQDSNGQPAKMKALHSSAALVVNVFDYWASREPAPLASALRIDMGIQSIRFEATFDTGLGGTPPHLDVVITDGHETVIAIESKFTEWMVGKSFASAYFPESRGVWAVNGLSACQKAAEETYNYLDATQLLKHALGLATKHKDRFELCYLYYDVPGAEGDRHRAEIGRFSDSIGAELRFKALSYQELFRRIKERSGHVDVQYLDYLSTRYFSWDAPVKT